jgi:hypothetical protein
MTDELERDWKVGGINEVLAWHFQRGTRENYEKLRIVLVIAKTRTEYVTNIDLYRYL